MSRMLNLIDAGWESVRFTARHGRRSDALTRATRLLARPDLPASVAAEAHRLAGELATNAERYAEARRHLRAAAALEPTHARTFYLWGVALDRDPDGCDRRAAQRFRRAAELETGTALYRAAFGRAAVRCGRTATGVRALLAAADAGAGDVSVVRPVIDGLIAAGRVKAARRVLTRARFLCPGDRELVGLWERVRFEAARRGQEQRARREVGGTTRHGLDAEFARDGGRVVLPFVRLAREGVAEKQPAGYVRRDVVSLPRPHFPRLMARKADR